jgi:hypothetical protein
MLMLAVDSYFAAWPLLLLDNMLVAVLLTLVLEFLLCGQYDGTQLT